MQTYERGHIGDRTVEKDLAAQVQRGENGLRHLGRIGNRASSTRRTWPGMAAPIAKR